MRPLRALFLTLVALSCTTGPNTEQTITATPQDSQTSERLIGLDAANHRVVWASGTGGTYVRTVDGGKEWTAGQVPGADSLQFRDVHAVSADTAYLLSIGEGEQSRIYKTVDGGASWTRSFVNRNPDAFFDCMDFWDSGHGIAFSDAVDGEFVLIRTDSGGDSWKRLPAEGLPQAAEGEASFAASGTCLVTRGDSTAYFGTGAVDTARVIRTRDRGATWTSHATPVEAGAPVAGIASLAFRDDLHGAAAGGILTTDPPPDTTIASIALTNDGGESWSVAPSSPLPGVFGATYVPNTDPPLLVVVGPEGAYYSSDDGDTWTRISTESHWSVSFGSADDGWAVGPDGRITHFAVE